MESSSEYSNEDEYLMFFVCLFVCFVFAGGGAVAMLEDKERVRKRGNTELRERRATRAHNSGNIELRELRVTGT